MEIVLIWSWFSFVVGLLAGPVLLVIVAIGASYKNWKKRQSDEVTVESLFKSWPKNNS